MLKIAAAIALAGILVLTSGAANARRFSLGKSASAKPAAPMSKPAVANAGAASSRGGTFVVIGAGGNQNRAMAAAPREPIPERGPLHEIASAMDQMPPVAEKPSEQPIGQKPEAPAAQIKPVFVSLAGLAERPAERIASGQPAKTVYCVKQANGACAPF